MNRLIAPLALCLFAAVALAEAPTSQPATQADWKQQVAENPEVEAILKKVPVDTHPRLSDKPEDSVSRNKRLREWDKTNIDGKKIKLAAFYAYTTRFNVYLSDGSRIQIAVAGKMTGDTGELRRGDAVKIEGTVGKGGLLLSSHEGKNNWSITLTDATVTKDSPK